MLVLRLILFFEDKTVDNFLKTLEINLIGTFLVSKYVGKYMLENKKKVVLLMYLLRMVLTLSTQKVLIMMLLKQVLSL